MKDQQEAEKKKVTSQEIQEQLGVQTEHIKEKKKVVLDDLSKVEPAVKEAQQGTCTCVGPRCRGRHSTHKIAVYGGLNNIIVHAHYIIVHYTILHQH